MVSQGRRPLKASRVSDELHEVDWIDMPWEDDEELGLMAERRCRRQELSLRSNAYEYGHLHLVHLGDIFHRRYLVLQKLGYGMYSTV